MKIGFDAKRIFHNFTGLGNYSRNTVRLLSTYFPENQYMLYTPKPGKAPFSHNESNTEILYPQPFIHKLFPSYWRVKLMVSQLRKDKPDVYFGLSNELPNGIERTGIKTIVTIHDLIFLRHPEFYSKIDRKIYEYKFRRACFVAHKIIAISRQTKNDIVNYFGIGPEKIDVVYQGCNTIFHNDAGQESKTGLVKKYKLPQRYILTVGSIEKRKNILNLVKAIRPLKSENLIIIGRKTSYYKEVSDYIMKNKMENRVRFFFGVPREELPVFYQLAGLFVYPSFFEGFGIPLIEALFSKTPVISSTGSCFSEAGGPDSIYVDPNDTDSLTAAIKKVLTNDDLYNNMAYRGYQYVQQFRDEPVANNLFGVIESIL